MHTWAERGLNFFTALVFILMPFWVRLPPELGLPYFAGFILAIPAGLAAFCWILSGFGGWTAWERLTPFLLPWLMFIPFGFFSQRWAKFPEPSANAALQLLAMGLWVVTLITSRIDYRRIAWNLTLSLGFHGLIAVGQAIAQRPLGLTFLGEYIIRPGTRLNTLRAEDLLYLRPPAFTAHPNMLAGFLVIGLIVAVSLFIDKNLKPGRIFIIGGCIGIGWLALLLTFSRAAWLGLVAGGLTFLLLCLIKRIKFTGRRVIPLVAACAIIGVGWLIAYRPFVFARVLAGDTSSELRSVVDRTYFMEYTLAMIGQSPLVGVGIGMNDWESAQMIVADPRKPALTALPVHNVPLLIWSELGTAGFLLWLTTLAGAGFLLLRYLRQGGADPLVFGLLAAFAGLWATSLLDFYMWRLFPYFVLWYGVLSASLSGMNQHQIVGELAGE